MGEEVISSRANARVKQLRAAFAGTCAVERRDGRD